MEAVWESLVRTACDADMCIFNRKYSASHVCKNWKSVEWRSSWGMVRPGVFSSWNLRMPLSLSSLLWVFILIPPAQTPVELRSPSSPFGRGKAMCLTIAMLWMHSRVYGTKVVSYRPLCLGLILLSASLKHSVKCSFKASRCVWFLFSANLCSGWWCHILCICTLVKSYVLLFHIGLYSLILVINNYLFI